MFAYTDTSQQDAAQIVTCGTVETWTGRKRGAENTELREEIRGTDVLAETSVGIIRAESVPLSGQDNVVAASAAFEARDRDRNEDKKELAGNNTQLDEIGKRHYRRTRSNCGWFNTVQHVRGLIKDSYKNAYADSICQRTLDLFVELQTRADRDRRERSVRVKGTKPKI